MSADIEVAEPPVDTIKVAILYNPFNAKGLERHELVYNSEWTLKDYLQGLPENSQWVVGHGGKAYEEPQWGDVKIAPGEGFSLVLVPEGGGGGGKDILRMIALIAVMVVAVVITGGGALAATGAWLGGGLGIGATAGSALLGAFVGIAGSLLVNAILPPATPTSKQSPATYGYDGVKNTSQEGIVVPIVYGTYRVGGNIVDLYTKNIADDQYMFMRTIVNDGKVKSITDLQVNDEAITNYSNIETRIALGEDDGQTNDWFGESVVQVSKGIKLSQNWVTHTTSREVDRLRLAVQFPGGLNYKQSKTATVTLEFQYKPHGAPDTAYTALTSQTISTFAQLLGGTAALPGYGFAPLPARIGGGYTQMYGQVVDQDTTGLVDQATVTGDHFYEVVPNPLTGADEIVLGIPLPLGSINVEIEALAALYTNDDDNGAAFHAKAMYRRQGESTWTMFAQDSGSVSPNTTNGAYNTYPLNYRTWSLGLDPSAIYEVAIFGGTPVNVNVATANAGGGMIPITRSQTSAVRFDYESGILAYGFYDVRVRRTNDEHPSGDHTVDSCYLSDVSEIQLDNIQYVGTANISLKIKMNDQLSSIPKLTALVEGSIVKMWNEDGEITGEEWAEYPPDAVLDMLMNNNRGRGLPANRIDFPAFKAWRDFCVLNNYRLNIVFDQDSNVWDSSQICFRVGHASISRVGTKWSVICDQPSEKTMMFNDSSIIKGTFQTDWLALEDRANEIHYTYFDASNDYTQAMLRVTDPNAPNTGAGLRVSEITQLGVTDTEQAKVDVQKQLRENALITKTVTFEAPLEAIGCTIGDVVGIQHTSANYGRNIGSGRLKPGSTKTKLNLDAPVTILDGVTYKAMLLHAAVKQYDVTVITANESGIYVSGLPSTIGRVSRFVQGDLDLRINNVVDGDPNDIIYVEGSVADVVAGPAELWVTDYVDEVELTNLPGSYTTVNLAAPLKADPVDKQLWAIGPVETVEKLFRLRTISGSDILQRKLVFTEYNPDIYLPLGITITPATPPTRTPAAQATLLNFSYPSDFSGITGSITINVSWQAGEPYRYGGADIYQRLNGGNWTYLRSVQNVTTFQTQLAQDDDFQFKVVAFDINGVRANINYAPTVGGIVTLSLVNLDPPANIRMFVKDWLVTARCRIDWDPSASPGVQGYLVEYVNLDQDEYTAFTQDDTLLPEDTAWNVAGLAPTTTIDILKNEVGYLMVRVRAVYGQAVSPWVYAAFDVEAPNLPTRVTGLTLDNAVGDPLNGVFTGQDAKFSWRDVAEEARALVESGADTNGMDVPWRDYLIEIKSPEGQLLRRETTSSPFYIYTYEKNVEDNGLILGPGHARRQFVILVYLRGEQGQISDPAYMEAINPAPPLMVGTLKPSVNSIQIEFAKSPDTDFDGALVWASTDPECPTTPENQVWDGKGKPIFFVNAQTTYYIRWAGYDLFGKDQLNITEPLSTATAGIGAGSVGQDLLDRLALIDGDPDLAGSVAQRIAAEAAARALAIAQSLADEVIDRDAAIAAAVVGINDTIADGDSALSTRIDGVVAQVNGVAADVLTEQTARVDADGALSDRIDSVLATANSNSAAIVAEATARATADGALSTRIDAVVATASGNAAAITDEATARADADSALSDRIDTVSAQVSSAKHTYYQATPPTTGMVENDLWFDTDDGNKPYIYSGDPLAWVEITDTRLLGNIAAISNEATARADADSALADDITSVLAIANGAAAQIATEITARADADGALSDRIDVLSATVDDNSAAITTEQTARADAVSAVATQVSSLSTTVDGHTTTISAFSSSINGLQGRAGLTIDSNGHVTGWTLNNDGQTGSFVVVADRFAVNAPGGNYSPFYVSGGRAYMDSAFIGTLDASVINVGTLNVDRIGDLSIGTGKVATGAITNAAVYTGSETTLARSGPGNNVVSGGFSTVGGRVLIQFTDTFQRSGGHSPTGYYALYRDGSLLWQVMSGGSGVTVSQPVALSFLDSPSAAFHSYEVKAYVSNGDDPSCVSKTPALVLTELKR